MAHYKVSCHTHRMMTEMKKNVLSLRLKGFLSCVWSLFRARNAAIEKFLSPILRLVRGTTKSLKHVINCCRLCVSSWLLLSACLKLWSPSSCSGSTWWLMVSRPPLSASILPTWRSWTSLHAAPRNLWLATGSSSATWRSVATSEQRRSVQLLGGLPFTTADLNSTTTSWLVGVLFTSCYCHILW